MTRMLYKCPGPHDIHGGKFDYLIVADEPEAIEAAEAEGWHLTTSEAKAAHEATLAAQADQKPAGDETNPPTRAELEQKAHELGLKFDGRTGNKKLAEAIAEKLKA